jgi:homoserine dehydrogenase
MGVVGTGVVRLLQENLDLVRAKSGLDLQLTTIASRSIQKFDAFPLDDYRLTTDPLELVSDPDVDIVVELLGGYDPARDLVLGAIRNGKAVVTANKALLARDGADIFRAANSAGVEVGFEASVAGTIPVIRALSEGLAANRIEGLMGILNGTCNFILSRMDEDGLTFDAALQLAKEGGYAEADPTLDISGQDAAHKLSILAGLAFGIPAPMEKIYVEGIERITQEDIRYAREFGYVIKLLAIAKAVNGDVELRVHPTLIPTQHPLASVRNEFNAMFVQGDASGETMYYGRGAGQMPTASAVWSDIIEIGERIVKRKEAGQTVSSSDVTRARKLYWADSPIRPIEDVTCRYYLRFPVVDRPGVIGIITSVLGQKSVSIAAVHADLIDPSNEAGTVEILTHTARERDIRDAMDVVAKNPVLRDRGEYIRIEE